MKISQILSVGAALLVIVAATTTAAQKPPRGKNCPKSEITLGQAVEMLNVHRTYKGPDGESHIEMTSLPGTTKSFYDGKTTLTQFDLGDPTRVMLVYGHPDIEIPKHPSPYREIFIILSGSSIMEMPDGAVIERKPGSMVIVEDQGTPGRSGRAGPCGYVALDLQFKDAPAK